MCSNVLKLAFDGPEESSGLPSMGTAINEMIQERMMEVSDTVIRNDPKCNECKEAVYALYRKIEKSLPEEQKKLMMEFESVFNNELITREDVLYRQGFQDGINFVNAIR